MKDFRLYRSHLASFCERERLKAREMESVKDDIGAAMVLIPLAEYSKRLQNVADRSLTGRKELTVVI